MLCYHKRLSSKCLLVSRRPVTVGSEVLGRALLRLSLSPLLSLREQPRCRPACFFKASAMLAFDPQKGCAGAKPCLVQQDATHWYTPPGSSLQRNEQKVGREQALVINRHQIFWGPWGPLSRLRPEAQNPAQGLRGLEALWGSGHSTLRCSNSGSWTPLPKRLLEAWKGLRPCRGTREAPRGRACPPCSNPRAPTILPQIMICLFDARFSSNGESNYLLPLPFFQRPKSAIDQIADKKSKRAGRVRI